ncbi:hypothetical protein EB796_006498 [Bugula neritina]|uniref:Uncharacterized protein n=1 Tax=Bugula neritina TaxID=10212 RepID=A0A7J7KCD9_BUGNE|nr:hypothetical protein EB796_006498 [Bugula neritina]
MSVIIRRSWTDGSSACACIDHKMAEKRKQLLKLGKENLKVLKKKKRNIRMQLAIRRIISNIKLLSKSKFRKQYLEMHPEEGLCTHMLSSSESQSSDDESEVNEDQREGQMEYNSEISPEAERFINYLEEQNPSDFSEQSCTDNNEEGDLHSIIQEMEESNNSDNVTNNDPLLSSVSSNEFPHTPVDDPESDEAILSMLDYLINQ